MIGSAASRTGSRKRHAACAHVRHRNGRRKSIPHNAHVGYSSCDQCTVVPCAACPRAPAPRPRSVPSDWFLDPADPQAGVAGASLEDQATAFLTAHDLDDETGTPAATVTALFPGDARPAEAEPVSADWAAIPGVTTEPVEGELAWQADALCAQTDPEAFFPEKGGSTRDAKIGRAHV